MVLLLPSTNFEYFKTHTNNSDPPLETNGLEGNNFQPILEVFQEINVFFKPTKYDFFSHVFRH